MNTCAFLLILTVQIYADGIEGPTGKAHIHLNLLSAVGKFVHVDETPLKAKVQRVWCRCQLCVPVPNTLLRLSVRYCYLLWLSNGTTLVLPVENKDKFCNKFVNSSIKFSECQTPSKILLVQGDCVRVFWENSHFPKQPNSLRSAALGFWYYAYLKAPGSEKGLTLWSKVTN